MDDKTLSNQSMWLDLAKTAATLPTATYNERKNLKECARFSLILSGQKTQRIRQEWGVNVCALCRGANCWRNKKRK